MEIEGSGEKYEVVGFSGRLFAYNIDITLLMLLFIGCSFLIENNSIFYAFCLIMTTLYYAVLESSDWQGTPGKRYNGLMVVDANGRKISFPRALLRIIFKYLSVFLLFAGIFMIYLRKDRKSLHDLVSGTYVVKPRP
ncbi:MAG: RDD family protein [Cyclobacteriaceae bacterium]